MTQNEEYVYIFALRYSAGYTSACNVVIREIVQHIQELPNLGIIMREIQIRKADVEREIRPWGEAGEQEKFIDLEAAVLDEMERRSEIEEYLLCRRRRD